MAAAMLPEPSPALLKKLRLRVETDDPIFPGWKKLKIRGKDLNDLPPEVFMLLELEVLDLSPEREACINYRIGRLPPGIGNLTSLRILMLDTNELDQIPEEICLLTLLERLSLSNNFIRSLPVGFNRLQRLECLYLANNRFEQFPPAICELYELRYLDLSDNLIGELPAAIANLRRLESLLLAYNRINHLPDSICDMISLHLLWVGYNRLRRLPLAFHRLANLDWGVNGHTSSLAIDGNPMVDPPVDVCKQGVLAIGDYMATNGGRIVITPAPPPVAVATTPVSHDLLTRPRSSLLVRPVSVAVPMPPPPVTTVIESARRPMTPLVEIRPRYEPVPTDVVPMLLPIDPYHDLTYYGTNHR